MVTSEHKTTHFGFGDLDKTVEIITKTIRDNYKDLKDFSLQFQDDNCRNTAYNIWNYIKQNISYVKDTPGIEQIRTPQRTLADKQGDCEDYSILASSVLLNLGYKPELIVVAFGGDYQHIYVVCENVVIDGVMNTFNQHPAGISNYFTIDIFSNNKKYFSGMPQIDLLSGIDGDPAATVYADIEPEIDFDEQGNALVEEDILPDMEAYIDAYENTVNGLGDIGELGRRRLNFLKKIRHRRKPPHRTNSKAVRKYNRKKRSRKVTKFIKKYNPAFAAARNAFLLILKVNTFRLASKLYFGQLNRYEVEKYGIDKNEWQKANTAYKKFVAFWRKAGGDLASLQKAIKHGRKFLLKKGVINGLGDPATAAAVGSAVTASAPFWKKALEWFKNVDFKKMFKNSNLKDKARELVEKVKDRVNHSDNNNTAKDKTNLPAVPNPQNYTDNTNNNKSKEKKNNWILPVIIGAGGLMLLSKS